MQDGSSTPLAVLLCAGALITVVTLWRMPETSADALTENDVPAPASAAAPATAEGVRR
ncbi:hypothetical protein ACH4SP_05810 [Streptomyces sp. NPDC021093]|uniref:hypothetical protein n=1 Tax=Streptomyces sp. NPDC021093 TaxID=3365112 RepID=UPI0037A1452C